MRLLYSKPRLKDLSQGSRISFIRQFRHMSQDDVSDMLGLLDENRRRTITRYETNERSPSESRLIEIAKILLVDPIWIKNYSFQDKKELICFALWLDELYPKMRFDFEDDDEELKDFFNEFQKMKDKRIIGEIQFDEYIEWKLNYLEKEDKYE